MSKPVWEEIWELGGSVYAEEFYGVGIRVGPGHYVHPESSRRWDEQEEDVRSRARLASAAPEMARLLLSLYWSGDDEGYCPACNGQAIGDEEDGGQHFENCALVACLRKAGCLE